MIRAVPPDEYWEKVYERVGAGQVSWFQPDAAVSLQLIGQTGAVSSIIDVGGGASVLVDRLLAAGVVDVTVLDVAASALRTAQQRLGARGAAVSWIERDVLTWRPTRRYEVWHDRAVYHFLTSPADRLTYRSVLKAALRPGGHMVIGTFAADGPTRCSGLPVSRYSPTQLAAQFPDLRMRYAIRELHRTPAGALQPFTWLLLARDSADEVG